MPQTEYGDISPRTAAYAASQLLERGQPFLVLEKFGQMKPVPKNESDSIKFRKYTALDPAPNTLTEGVTPSSKQLSSTDVSTTLDQYGDLVEITDKIEDTHEDPVLDEAVDILGEQAAQMIETVRFNVLKAGTNVSYANGSARSDVNTPITRSLQRKATRSLKNQHARQITKVAKSSAKWGTQPVQASYIGLVHPDLEGDIRNMPGFVPSEEYGTAQPYESEIGKVEGVRYVYSTIFEPWEDSGGAYDGSGEAMLSTSGTNADVYPALIIAQNAYGIVPLKGNRAIRPSVLNPGSADKSDPLGQKGYAGWKAYQACVILQDAWMIRLELAASEDA